MPSRDAAVGVASARYAIGLGVLALAGAVAATSVGLVLAWPAGHAGGATPSAGSSARDIAVRALWRSAPAADLLPADLTGTMIGTYVRVGLDQQESCAALPEAFRVALAPTICVRDIQATYVDQTQTVSATVGIVVLSGSAAERTHFAESWSAAAASTDYAMMPHVYPVPGTAAALLSDYQRIAWDSAASANGTYLTYAVCAFTDGRSGPDAARFTARSGSALQPSSLPVEAAGALPVLIQRLISIQDRKQVGGP